MLGDFANVSCYIYISVICAIEAYWNELLQNKYVLNHLLNFNDKN